jgi:hypothetical protein
VTDVYVRWETIGGDKYRGKIVEYDDGVLIVECHDGKKRGVQESGVEECCPDCNGSGRFHIPSDGYENSKSGPCQECRGHGTLLQFARYQLSRLEENVEALVRDRKYINNRLKETRALIKRCEGLGEIDRVFPRGDYLIGRK